MEMIKELSTISTYEPEKGVIYVLYQLLHKGYSVNDSQTEIGLSKERIWGVYKQLKDRLIDGLFEGFKDCTKFQEKHIRIYKNFAACQSLKITDRLNTWLPIATETLTMAKKYGEIAIASHLADELKYHYSISKCDSQKFKFYSQKSNTFWRLLAEQRKADMLYVDLVFALRKRRDLSFFPSDLQLVREIAENNQEYLFNLAFRSSEITWYQYQNDTENLIESCKSAIQFFRSIKTPIPYTTAFTFYLVMLPVLIRKNKFAMAERTISKLIELPPVGGYNWNLVLIYKALLGFHSNKPQISFDAFKMAQNAPKKFQSDSISEQWQIIKAYIQYFKKRGKINFNESWRLGTFLNSVPSAETQKSGQNVAVILAKLLHYLASRRKVDFMKATEYTESYINSHLRSKQHIRSKAILRIMRCVEMADYNPIRFERYAKKHIEIIEKNPSASSVNFLDSEVIPFEVIIREVRENLKT